jgi:hypothetical protein
MKNRCTQIYSIPARIRCVRGVLSREFLVFLRGFMSSWYLFRL